MLCGEKHAQKRVDVGFIYGEFRETYKPDFIRTGTLRERKQETLVYLQRVCPAGKEPVQRPIGDTCSRHSRLKIESHGEANEQEESNER